MTDSTTSIGDVGVVSFGDYNGQCFSVQSIEPEITVLDVFTPNDSFGGNCSTCISNPGPTTTPTKHTYKYNNFYIN